MKVLSFALALVLGADAASVGNNQKTLSLVGRRVQNKRKLLRHAIPVDRNGRPRSVTAAAVGKRDRRLEENEFEVTADYSIQFNECLSLSTEPEDEDVMFGDDTIAYTKNGQIVSQKSFVLFNLCETQYCDYEEESEDNMYMVDLATYMGAMAGILPQEQNDYCEACQDAYDVCMNNNGQGDNANGDGNEDDGDDGDEDEGEGEDDEGEDEDGEGEDEGEDEDGEGEDGEDRRHRRLTKKVGKAKKTSKRRKLDNANVQYVDCYTCQMKGCFDENENDDNNNNNNNNNNNQNNGQVDMEELAEWVEELVECQDTEMYWNDLNLYGGFMCNAAGTGVEVAVFLDEDCSVYTTKKSYKSLVAGTNNYNYLYSSQDIVTYPFMNDVSCEQIEYASPYEDEDDGDDEQDDDQQEAEVAEYCRELFEGGALSLYDCGGEDQDNNNNQDEDDDQQQNDYYWYEYQLSQEDAEDNYGACMIIQAFEGEYSDAHYYDENENDGNEGSGTVYDYSKATAEESGGTTAAQRFGFVVLVVIVIAAVIAVAQTMSKKKNMGGNSDKKTPLVKRSGGAMA